MSESSELRLVGGYRLLRHLGSGGAGSVWEATDEAGARVAFKLIHPALAGSEESRARLVKEARLVNQIPGPGVARVMDYEADSDIPFVVTELVKGPTLEQAVQQRPLDRNEAILLALQLADLLERVHGAGIVHRDLKPSNIILSAEGPVLIDFGIAHDGSSQRLTQTGLIMGTPGFVSPELLRGGPDIDFDTWCAGDWWALHALLLSSLTGAPPFGSGPWDVVLGRVMAGEALTDGLDPNLALALRGALHPDPASRSTTDAIVHALRTTSPSPVASPTRVMAAAALTDTLDVENQPQTSRPWYWAPILLGWLATLPVLLGVPGLEVAAALLLVWAGLGAGVQWLDKSPSRRRAWAWVASPWHLIWGAITLIPGTLAAYIVATVVWTIFYQNFDFTFAWQWWSNIPGGPLSAQASWLTLWSALLVGYLLPTSRPLRTGINTSVNWLFRRRWLRVVAALLAFGALALTVSAFS